MLIRRSLPPGFPFLERTAQDREAGGTGTFSRKARTTIGAKREKGARVTVSASVDCEAAMRLSAEVGCEEPS